jgi:phosphatidylglycerophosphate synthase
MLEVYLRPIYQLYIVNPIAKKTAFSPLQITILACLSGVVAGFALSLNFYKLAILFLLLSGFLDTLDGTVARMENSTSSIGAIADILSDRIVELAIILGLFFIDPQHRSIPTLMMLGSCYLCITAFLVVGIFTANRTQKEFTYSIGLMERLEAFIFFVAMIMWPMHFNSLAYLFSGLVLVTTVLHVRNFLKKNP